jgi:hypothetical protein
VLPGLSGHLVSEKVLEETLNRDAPPPEAIRARLRERWERLRLGPATSLRAMFEAGAAPLLDALGFEPSGSFACVDGCAFSLLRAGSNQVGLLVCPWGDRLDSRWRTAIVAALHHGTTWSVLFNGTHMRIVSADRVYSRRYVDIDLASAAYDPRSFGALWRVGSADTFADRSGQGAPIARLVAESERYAHNVCRSLRDGVLASSERLLDALTRRPVQSVDSAFEQALTLVYRILFLLFAEARSLVPVWHRIYRNSYSVAQLREDATSRRASGFWDALRAISRLAHAGCRAGDLQVTPFNGRLFSPARTPLLERRDLDEEAIRQSVIALTTRRAPDGQAREAISYRDLGVEQLGAVYETLLDYRPQAESAASARSSGAAIQRSSRPRGSDRPLVRLRAGSGIRKSTGTFYTPQPVARYLIRRALAPLVRGAAPERILALRVLDPSMGSGAFLVGACAFLADAYESALVESGECHPGDLGPEDRAGFRRLVAERCLYGVDLNPMAVQLARLSLWLTSLAADRPLSFLDHHLAIGDSLLGCWLACLRRPPGEHRMAGGRQLPLFDGHGGVTATLRAALPVRFDLARVPNDTPQQVRAKERALAALGDVASDLGRWKRVADLWCARWFGFEREAPPASAFMDLADAILKDGGALPTGMRKRYLQAAADIAVQRRFLHWELEFPEIFFDASGTRLANPGFDAVIGNPPWEMLRGDSGSGDRRVRGRQLAAATVRFARESGSFSARGDGHANCYQLFLDRAMALTRAGGRIGLVLPSGITADHGSAALRRQLFATYAVDALVGFDNRRAIFPVHRSVRFVLLTATSGAPTSRIACRFGEHDPAVLETHPDDNAGTADWFPVQLTTQCIERLSGESCAVPELRAAIDVAIAERAATLFPPLGARGGWNAQFGRELNASDDRGCFRTGGGLPVMAGRHIEPFRCDVAAATTFISERDASRRLGHRHRRPRLAYRDVASATNRQTLIAAMLPADCVTTHTLFCLRSPLAGRSQQFLCGLLNSYVLNYLVRQRVTTHVTTALVERLPVPTAAQAAGMFAGIAAMSRLLGRRPDVRMLARLNARVAQLYRLSLDEFAHVLTTFPLVPDAEREASLRMFRAIAI